MTATDPTSPTAEGGDLPAPPRPRRIARKLFLGFVVLLIVLAGLGAAMYRPWLSSFARERAAALGVVIGFDDIAYDGHAVTLQNARATLAGVRGLSATATELRIDLDGLEPTAIHATNAAVSLEGSATDLVLDLTEWAARHAEAFKIPGAATGVALAWTDAKGTPPWLELAGGVLASTGRDAKFRAPRLKLQGISLGPTGAVWTAEPATIAVGVGAESIEGAPFRAEVHPLERPPTADVVLRPIRLEALGAPFGMALPAPGAIAEGKIHLVQSTASSDVRGTVEMSLTGWVPPHPRELDGIVFGNRTTFTTKVEIPGDRRRLTLSDSMVTAGAFRLGGSGSIERRGQQAAVHMDMRGSIPCTALARSAAAVRIGGELGKLVANVASQALRGSVAVVVRVDADTGNIAAAKITQDVGVGCGLRIP